MQDYAVYKAPQGYSVQTVSYSPSNSYGISMSAPRKRSRCPSEPEGTCAVCSRRCMESA